MTIYTNYPTIAGGPRDYYRSRSAVQLNTTSIHQPLWDYVAQLKCPYIYHGCSIYTMLLSVLKSPPVRYEWTAIFPNDAGHKQLLPEVLDKIRVEMTYHNYDVWSSHTDEYLDEMDRFLERVSTDWYHIASRFKNIISTFEYKTVHQYAEILPDIRKLTRFLQPTLDRVSKYYLEHIKEYSVRAGYNSYTYNSHTKHASSSAPGGQCDYRAKSLYLNTDLLHKFKHPQWTKHIVTHIYLHELGHSIDYVGNRYPFVYNIPSTLKLCCQSYALNFKNTVRKNEKASRKIKYRARKANYLDYFCRPSIYAHGDVRIPKRMFNDDSFLYGNIKVYDYSQAMTETWAESFALILRLMEHGFNEYDIYALRGPKSKTRIQIQAMINSLYYLLDNVDWRIFNIPTHKIGIKKYEIRSYLTHLAELPHVIPGVRHAAWRVPACKIKNFKHLRSQALKFL